MRPQRPREALVTAGLACSLVLLAGLTGAVQGAERNPALPLRIEDSMAQRMQACTPCHGRQGVATAEGYFPRIAGKPQGYLFEQLLNFKEGRRGNATMRHLVQPLSVGYLQEIAGHFASLDLPYPAPEAQAAEPAAWARGRQLAMEGDASLKLPACAACHGSALTGTLPATPGLLGLSKDYLSAQLGAWRNGLRRAREPDCMKAISQRLLASDLHAVSAYLAAQPLPRQTRAVSPPPARADTLDDLPCGPAHGPRM